MGSPLRTEIWRTKHVKDAYADQTGKTHWGTVVYEQLIVEDTGERYDVDDGYQVHRGHGRVFQAEDGRRFGLHTETVDYTGGTHVRELGSKRHGVLDTNVSGEPQKMPGFWRRAPVSRAGYVYPNGDGPVIGLLDADAERAAWSLAQQDKIRGRLGRS